MENIICPCLPRFSQIYCGTILYLIVPCILGQVLLKVFNLVSIISYNRFRYQLDNLDGVAYLIWILCSNVSGDFTHKACKLFR